MCFRLASSVVLHMFHALSFGQGPGLCSTCFMWFRGASVVLEMLHVDSGGQRGSRFVVLEMFLMVSCGQQGTPDVSCGFVWPVWYSTAWYSRCFLWFRVASVVVDMFHVVPCGQRGIRDVFGAASMVVDIIHAV